MITSLLTPIFDGISWLGELTLFGGRMFLGARHFSRRWGIFIHQCEFIGVSSLGILTTAAIFMGAALGYQLYTAFALFGAQALVGGTLGVALFREMAPVMAAIMVTGRAGAAIGAEVASMRVSEQIDALDVMGVDPFEYLVVPRVMAGITMMPLLAIIFGAIASLAGCLLASGVMGLSMPVFWKAFKVYVDWVDLLQCVVKGATFGGILSTMGCFFGFRAKGGASAVGFSTRSTVVATCLMILLMDYFWTMVLPLRAPKLYFH